MSVSRLINFKKINVTDYKSLPHLSLKYGTAPSPFGNCLMAFHENILCFLTFFDKKPPLEKLKVAWPNADLIEDNSFVQKMANLVFGESQNKIDIYLKGTDFQMEVWEALLKIKKGATLSYEGVAKSMGRPRATRAVASAVGKNNIAYIVPCHRVINKDGTLGKFGCGPQTKLKMLNDEGVDF